MGVRGVEWGGIGLWCRCGCGELWCAEQGGAQLGHAEQGHVGYAQLTRCVDVAANGGDYLMSHHRDGVCGEVTQCGDVMMRAGWHTVVMWPLLKGHAGAVHCVNVAAVVGALW